MGLQRRQASAEWLGRLPETRKKYFWIHSLAGVGFILDRLSDRQESILWIGVKPIGTKQKWILWER